MLFSLGALGNDAKPNILFISVDDLNNYISPLAKHPGVITPNFDRLARQSVTFTNAHCAAPACHPSRVAVMTGVHPIKSGIYRNLFGAHGPRWRHEAPALSDTIVLSKHFSNHGYHSAGAGKIFHTLQWTPGDSQNDPLAWDEYRGDPLDPISADWPRPDFPHNQNHGFQGRRPLSNFLFGATPLPQAEDTYGDHLIVDWAIERLKTQPTKPQFLAVGLFRPHIPFEVPQKYFDLYPIDEVQLPADLENDLADARPADRVAWHKWVTDNDQWKPLMQGYLASISYVDHQLGRLLDALESSPMKNNTIVVLWTDHGFHIGEKSNWEKFALWNQTTNTPLFIHAPGISRDGGSTKQPATLTDLYPTLCELCGLPVPSQCTGTSLLPQLKDPSKARSQPSLTSFVFNRDMASETPSHALSDDRYRYIKYADGFEELYDLNTDPEEFHNLATHPDHQAARKRLAACLPKSVAKNCKVPRDSPFTRKNPNKTAHNKHPDITNRSFGITLKVTPDPEQTDGVIISHGGDHHGYSLYMKDGLIHFAVRRNKELETLIVEHYRPKKEFTISAGLNRRGCIIIDILSLADSPFFIGKKLGHISRKPNEGQTLNSDPESPVGNYTSPFSYGGKVKLLKFEADPKQ
ncbi:sulfatase [bacterium]|nr:sulfatase [bacterium]